MSLHQLTAGLVGPRDPAQPLLTYLDGDARVELSGSTTANWVSKTANLLTDGYGGPAAVGLLLPLHWQAVCFLLGGVAAGARVVVAATADDLADCELAFVSGDQAEAVLGAGVEEVLACSLTPFGTRLSELPPMVLDAAVEVPGYGDHFSGRPASAEVWLGASRFEPPPPGVGAGDRVLTALDPASSTGLGALLGTLRAGAALVLLRSGDREQALRGESATAWVDESGLHRV